MVFCAVVSFGSRRAASVRAYSSTIEPGRQDRNTGSKNVNDGAIVGEGSQAVSAVGGANGVGSRLRRGRRVGRIHTVVTCSDSKENTSRNDVSGGGVDCSGLGSSKRHVGDSAVGAAACLCVVGDIVDTSNDTGVGTLSHS